MKRIFISDEYFQKDATELLKKDYIIINEESLPCDLAVTSKKKHSLCSRLLQVIREGEDSSEIFGQDVIYYPFRTGELILRVDKLTKDGVFENGELRIDYKSCSVSIGKKAVHLTLQEYKLLCLLAQNAGQTVGYGEILRTLWDSPIGSEMLSVRVFVNALRKKLGESGGKYIETQMGKGYKMPVLK